MRAFRSLPALFAALVVAVGTGGCVQQSVKKVNEVAAKSADRDVPQSELLDVVVVAFDPGVPATAEAQKKENIYPSVRQAEANYFPQVLRQALDGTGYWGTVRVLPQATPGADVTVTGKILHSDGETLKLQIAASDATGRKWFDRAYEQTTTELAYTEKMPTPSDPFQDLYNRAANDLLAERRKLTAAQTTSIQRVADLRFAADLAPARFNEYLVRDKDGLYTVTRLPPADDPYVTRIEQIHARDDVLVDTLDAHYAVFRQQMQPTYQEWRKQSYTDTIQYREYNTQRYVREGAGALAIAAGIAAMIFSHNAGGQILGEAGVIGGVYGIQSGMSKGKEADIHAQSLKEINASLDADSQPRVMEIEGKTVTLTGSAKAQYDQWRKMLRDRYAAETGTAGS